MKPSTSGVKQSRLGRRVYVAVALLGFALLAFSLLGVDAAGWMAKKVGPPQEELGVPNTGYNFTSHYIEYQLGERTGGALPEGAANGGGIVCCYKPNYAGEPMTVRWRYYWPLAPKVDRNTWHYEAQLRPGLAQGSQGPLRLTVRFYPGDRVAARYTDQPERAYNGENVSQDLNGSGWELAQGKAIAGAAEKPLMKAERKS